MSMSRHRRRIRKTRVPMAGCCVGLFAVILLTAVSIFIGDRVAGGSITTQAPTQHQGGKHAR
jgi:hypothetical protein